MEKLIKYVVGTVFKNKNIVEELIPDYNIVKQVVYWKYKTMTEKQIKEIIKSNWIHYLYGYKELFLEIKEYITRDEFEETYKEDALIIKYNNTLYKLGCGDDYGKVLEVELKTKMIPYLYFENI
jgi:hypothetical protein